MEQRRWLGIVFLGVIAGALTVNSAHGADLILYSKSFAPHGQGRESRSLKLDGLFYETGQGVTQLPSQLSAVVQNETQLLRRAQVADGRVVTLQVKREGKTFDIRLSAEPDSGIIRWGVAVEAFNDEYYTGLMERVVDGPQQASWAPAVTQAMNLRGQKVDMILKPTTSIYAPFYLSSRGYAVFVKGNWPGRFDFCVDNPQRARIEFEGPSFEMKVYTSEQPAELVRQHALDAGPAFLPPKWMFKQSRFGLGVLRSGRGGLLKRLLARGPQTRLYGNSFSLRRIFRPGPFGPSALWIKKPRATDGAERLRHGWRFSRRCGAMKSLEAGLGITYEKCVGRLEEDRAFLKWRAGLSEDPEPTVLDLSPQGEVEFVERQLDTDIQNGKKRIRERWGLTEEAGRLLPEERVSRCCCDLVPKKTSVSIFVSQDSGRAFYGNLKPCGSLWVCAICAARISERKRKELQQALETFRARGGKVYHLTLTIPHHRGNDTRALCDQLLEARRVMQNRTSWRDYSKAIGLQGSVRALEVTYGNNGSHVHIHTLWFCMQDNGYLARRIFFPLGSRPA